MLAANLKLKYTCTFFSSLDDENSTNR